MAKKLPQIVPVINVKTVQKLKEKINLLKDFDGIFQLDVADGKFIPWKTWNSPEVLKKMRKIKGRFELHLMVHNPEQVLPYWAETGPRRIIVHCEAVKDFPALQDICRQNSIGLGVAINPETPLAAAEKYWKKADLALVLGVSPGPSGQKFEWFVLDRIRRIKKKFSNLVCEIDGGVNAENLAEVKKSGVDLIAVGSAIFESSDPLAQIGLLRKALKK